MSFSGKRLQTLRQTAGLSQAQLAAKAGMSVRSLQNWEIDRSKPKVDALLALAEALGVELADLAGLTKTKKSARGKR